VRWWGSIVAVEQFKQWLERASTVLIGAGIIGYESIERWIERDGTDWRITSPDPRASGHGQTHVLTEFISMFKRMLPEEWGLIRLPLSEDECRYIRQGSDTGACVLWFERGPTSRQIVEMLEQLSNTLVRLENLGDTERKLYEAAPLTEPLTGDELAEKAGVAFNSNTKQHLSTLVKMGLLQTRKGGGYTRIFLAQ
jgi:ribosomal protein L17